MASDDQYKALINKAALDNLQGKTPLSRFSYMDTAAKEHARSFTVAKMMDGDMLSETQDAITAALANGTDFREFEKQLKPYLMAKGWWSEQLMRDPVTGKIEKVQLGSTRRLRTIYHTNLHASYAAAKWERIQKRKKLMPFLQYQPSVSGNPRKAHKAYYGLIKPVDDAIWQMIMPPNGFGCLCSVRQLSKAQAAKAGGETLDFEPEMVESVNPRTGETLLTPVGIEPSFAHNHDRLFAIEDLMTQKVQMWTHVPDAKKALAKHNSELDAYMADYVADDKS